MKTLLLFSLLLSIPQAYIEASEAWTCNTPFGRTYLLRYQKHHFASNENRSKAYNRSLSDCEIFEDEFKKKRHKLGGYKCYGTECVKGDFKWRNTLKIIGFTAKELEEGSYRTKRSVTY